MSREHFIALDTHKEFCDMAVVSPTGKVVKRDRCQTNIPDLVEMISHVKRSRILTFEEGPMAGWLARSLKPYVDRLIVCDPKRNAYIAKDGDKDDPIDAEKLAQLLRGGFLKAVHQVDDLDRMVLKQHVACYHHRVRERVRQGHQLTSLLRRHGVFTSIAELTDPEQRRRCWRQMPARAVMLRDLDMIWAIYEVMCQQEEQLELDLVRLARREEPVRRFTALPGIMWIRAVTFYAYIDTPHRFTKKESLWKYCGIGLEKRHSGSGPMQLRVTQSGNRHLKGVLMGAALSAATQGDNPFADKYRYWTQEQKQHPLTACRNVARTFANTLWGMWKNGSEYDPELIRGVG
jgi:transposase